MYKKSVFMFVGRNLELKTRDLNLKTPAQTVINSFSITVVLPLASHAHPSYIKHFVLRHLAMFNRFMEHAEIHEARGFMLDWVSAFRCFPGELL